MRTAVVVKILATLMLVFMSCADSKDADNAPEKSLGDINSFTGAKDDVYLSISGKVLNVISGTEIEVQTDEGIILVTYSGVLIPDNRGVIRQTVRDFNEFLVQSKDVEIEYLTSNVNGNKKELKGFVFSSGELINLRLIESGLVVTDDSFEFAYKPRFKEAQEHAINLKLGIWDKDLGSICGTLPC